MSHYTYTMYAILFKNRLKIEFELNFIFSYMFLVTRVYGVVF